MQTQKSGFVALVGRPNTGKSTLLNALVGQKVAIVSPRPQTTRNRITAILNTGDTQIVFLDTPGLHRPRTELGDYMVRTAKESAGQVDIVALVVEPSAKPHPAEVELLESLRPRGAKVMLIINKIDLVKKQSLLAVISAYSEVFPFEAVVPVSALTKDGIPELVKAFADRMEPGPKYFPDDMLTTEPERQLVAELVREKLLYKLSDEVPHGTAVEVETFRERAGGGLIDISVSIYCERKSHKGIIIGKGGAMLREIASLARADIESLLGCRVFLQCWVKVREDWRNNRASLRSFGYE